MSEEKIYDLIIAGGGPAGLSAAIYASRAKLDTLVLEKNFVGGQMANTDIIENYPGFPDGVSGSDLVSRMEEQAEKFGAEIDFADIEGIEVDGAVKRLRTSEGDYLSRALIIATGTEQRKLGVKGEAEFTGRGVSYCAVCDGAFYTDKVIAVVGGGNSAVEEAVYLTNFASKVYLIHRRDSLRAEKLLQERLFANEKIEVVWNSVVTEIKGDKFVEAVSIKNLLSGEVKDLAVSGVFVYVGVVPNSQVFRGVLELDEWGYIKTNEEMETSVDGVFAAGDVRASVLKQVITAAAEGAIAATFAEKYVREQVYFDQNISSGKRVVVVYSSITDEGREIVKCMSELEASNVIAIDGYKNSRISKKLNVEKFSAVRIFDNGKEVFSKDGVAVHEIVNMLKEQGIV